MYVDFDKFRGFDDQEVLIKALANFASQKMNMTELHIKAIMNQSIKQWINDTDLGVKDIRHLPPHQRKSVVTEMIDSFIEHIKSIMEEETDRDNLKMNMLEIYEHWKKTIRLD